jgi:hypothetical protein
MIKQDLPAVEAPKGIDSIANGITRIKARIRTGKLKIMKHQCSCLMEEFDNYRYPTIDGEVASANPIDKMNHSIDALRYLINGFDKGKIY